MLFKIKHILKKPVQVQTFIQKKKNKTRYNNRLNHPKRIFLDVFCLIMVSNAARKLVKNLIIWNILLVTKRAHVELYLDCRKTL